MWSGCSARLVEGAVSGAVLMVAKEAILHVLVGNPICGFSLPPVAVACLAGAGGGAAQALVMGPCSLLVVACTAERAAGGEGSVAAVAQRVWAQGGLPGMYCGSGAVAARQATNWASRQGLTELLRPVCLAKLPGVRGELVAGCLGGGLSAWNTPFEVCRIEAQAGAGGSGSGEGRGSSSSGTQRGGASLWATMARVRQERGVAGLFAGLGPRVCQACYQTVFLVVVPRILDAEK